MAVILVDDERLNLSPIKSGQEDQRSDNEIWALEQIQEIQKIKKFRFFSKQPLTKENIAFKPPVYFDMAGVRMNPKTQVSEKWIYCNEPKRNAQTGDTWYPTFSYKASHSFTLVAGAGTTQLIFFLKCIMNLKWLGFELENKEAQANDKYEKRQLEVQVGHMIYDKLKFDELQKVSYRYNLHNIEEKGDKELRNELYDTIVRLDKDTKSKVTFKSFLDEFGDLTYTVLLANINKAVKDKIIAFDNEIKAAKYVKSGNIITHIPDDRYVRDKEDFVAEFFIRNEKPRNTFLVSCTGIFDQIEENQKKKEEEKKQELLDGLSEFKKDPRLENVTHPAQLASYLKMNNLKEIVKYPEDMKALEDKIEFVRKIEQDLKEQVG